MKTSNEIITIDTSTSGATSAAKPLRIDLTPAPPPPLTGHLGLGETQAPGGHTIWADSRCIYRDGQPVLPVMGELHYSRYPRHEWREALLKMKTGGVNIVATYVFWIHHEEEQGKYDWSGGRSLRDFLKLCQELDLLVVVRLGPWSHGEARNGGFPDWLQKAEFWGENGARRGLQPEYMKFVEVHYRQIAAQMLGLLWKDGGTVIGVQLDNECGQLDYLFALKKLAQACGMDVPFYTMTGWNAAPMPDEGLLPLFGGYVDGFWVDHPLRMRDVFQFKPGRVDGDMGAINGRRADKHRERIAKMQRYPYLCCEIGGGMISSYDVRIQVEPADVAACALVKLGSGNNLPGYYMYQGGVNPDGKLTTLNECKANYGNDLAVKAYDFGPLGACGQLHEHYFLLRLQHLFLHSFGDRLAVMPAFFPEVPPTALEDTDAVRWSVRSDGTSGFIFFNNYQRYQQLPAKEGVQFALNTRQGVLRVPQAPVTFPSGSYGIWPFNMDCAGVRLAYATAQPLGSLNVEGAEYYFFAAVEGLAPEFAVTDASGKTRVRCVQAGTDVAFQEQSADGRCVNFVVLPAELGKLLWKLPVAGRSRIILSSSTILPETANQLGVECLHPERANLAIFPPVKVAGVDNKPVSSTRDGIFQRFRFEGAPPAAAKVEAGLVKPAAVTAAALNAMEETSWESAAVWRLQMPRTIRAGEGLLRLQYVGDVARFYAGGRLLLDNFYNGEPFDLALWRLSAAELADLELRILPLRAGQVKRLPEGAAQGLDAHNAVAKVVGMECLEKQRFTVMFREG